MFNRNLYIFIQVNAFENVVWKMAAILSRLQCVSTVFAPPGGAFLLLSAFIDFIDLYWVLGVAKKALAGDYTYHLPVKSS